VITGIIAGIMDGRVLRESMRSQADIRAVARCNVGRILGWISAGLGAVYVLILLIVAAAGGSY